MAGRSAAGLIDTIVLMCFAPFRYGWVEGDKEESKGRKRKGGGGEEMRKLTLNLETKGGIYSSGKIGIAGTGSTAYLLH